MWRLTAAAMAARSPSSELTIRSPRRRAPSTTPGQPTRRPGRSRPGERAMLGLVLADFFQAGPDDEFLPLRLADPGAGAHPCGLRGGSDLGIEFGRDGYRALLADGHATTVVQRYDSQGNRGDLRVCVNNVGPRRFGWYSALGGCTGHNQTQRRWSPSVPGGGNVAGGRRDRSPGPLIITNKCLP